MVNGSESMDADGGERGGRLRKRKQTIREGNGHGQINEGGKEREQRGHTIKGEMNKGECRGGRSEKKGRKGRHRCK